MNDELNFCMQTLWMIIFKKKICTYVRLASLVACLATSTMGHRGKKGGSFIINFFFKKKPISI